MKKFIVSCDRCEKNCDHYFVVKVKSEREELEYEICRHCRNALKEFLRD